MGYWESVPLRQRIACHYDDQYGVDLDPQRILLTCGASPALVLALLTGFAAGSRVMTARPGYVAYRNSLRAVHMVPVEVECGANDRFQIHARHIRAADPAPDGLIVARPATPQRKNVGEGKRVIVRVSSGGARYIKKQKK